MITLHPYQQSAIEECEEKILAGARVCLVAPTGSGKTFIAAELIKRARAAGKRVLVLSHRREIIKQTSEKLHHHGITHGVIQAELPTRLGRRVQVASVQTLHARAMRTKRLYLPPAGLVVIDEAHHCPARTYRQIIAAYPQAALVGLTATPCRGDGRGLGGIFDELIECPQVAELIVGGYLVPTVVYAPAIPDLKGVPTQSGDYVVPQLADRMDRDALVGDIVTHWHKFGGARKTVCFAVNIHHSVHIRDEFIKSGVKAEHIDGSTPKPERDAVLARLASGETTVVANCVVLTEGWDMPDVGCCILARPTKRMGLYRQMVGRVLRPAPGKTNAVIIDHSGAVYRHGFVEDHVEWTLDADKYAKSPSHTERVNSKNFDLKLLECSQCGCWVRVAGQPCANCGFLPKAPPKAIVFGDGELARVDRHSRIAESRNDPHERMRWHGMLTYIQQDRGHKPGWIYWKFKEKFGTAPHGYAAPIEPTLEVVAWVRSRNIAYAKAMQKPDGP
jgi:DNA repair protein RadD